MQPPFLLGGGGAGEPHIKFLNEGGALRGPQFLRWVAEKEGVPVFQGWCNLLTKNKLKSGIFNDKKVYKQEFFVLT